MLATIWTSASGTTETLDKTVSVKDYYRGATFRPVAILENELAKKCDARLNIILDNGGYVSGDEQSTVLSDIDDVDDDLEDALFSSVTESEIIAIFLPSGEFEEYIISNWDQITERAQPNSLWCLGTSKTALKEVDLQMLEDKGCTVLVYERIGVAPIGTDTRDRLLNEVQDLTS